jgi:hypothetical protein
MSCLSALCPRPFLRAILLCALAIAGCDACEHSAPKCLYNNDCKGTRACPLANAGPICRRLEPGKGVCECLTVSWPEDAGSLYSDAGRQWCERDTCEILSSSFLDAGVR